MSGVRSFARLSANENGCESAMGRRFSNFLRLQLGEPKGLLIRYITVNSAKVPFV